MCRAKTLVTCPKCKNRIQITRPDSEHSLWSTDKPENNEALTSFVEQIIESKNQNYSNKFVIFWHEKWKRNNFQIYST